MRRQKEPPIQMVAQMVKKAATYLVFLPFLFGCMGKSDREELEEYVNQVKARKPAEIEALPVIKPYETFTYQASVLRSPFMVPKPTMQIVKKDVSTNGIQPDMERRREFLESFPMDALSMVGTLEREGKIWAVVMDKDGAVHRVTVGNYVGLNNGKIYKISEEKIFVKEIVSDPAGGWQERNSEMALKVEEE